MTQEPSLATKQAAGELEQFYPRIVRYAQGLLHDPADAQDAAQDTFVRAQLQRASLRDPQAALSWLYSIATHVSLDRLRQRTREAQRDAGIAPETLPAADASRSGELRAEQREMSACVQGLLGELPDNYRAVLLLHDAHGLSTPEIAELLSDTPGAVKIRLHRARKALRTSLTTACEFSHDDRGELICTQHADDCSRARIP